MPADALLRCGYRVRGTVRSLTGKRIEHLASLAPGSRFRLELVVADLLDATTWPAAVQGATYILHVASPFPLDDPVDESELIRPAVDGTLNVLRAAGKRSECMRGSWTSDRQRVFYMQWLHRRVCGASL